jgi:hypothetical protein
MPTPLLPVLRRGRTVTRQPENGLPRMGDLGRWAVVTGPLITQSLGQVISIVIPAE